MKKFIFIIPIIFFFWIVMEIYCRLPNKLDIIKINAPIKTQTMILLFHGSNDHKNLELEAIADKYSTYYNSHRNIEVINYDWSYASSYLKASANAIKIGNVLGLEISNLKELKNIHIIAHSAGSFIAESFCQSYKNNDGVAHIETTFLDPFNLRGLSDFNYGARTHGKCADFASSIINTDDQAPTTNSILENAWNIDVTNIDRPKYFKRTGHYFPPLFYLLSMNEDTFKMRIKNHNDYPRGGLLRARN
ncbi:MAG: hypothetical protein CFH14_01288 [Alphaproteobacteria bacterium MarineAlpha5_Bin4]|nr:MAG: hypothetical protein CFH14_01288 [Alphaproteobacteria bacterium MarineAlpha5_Bin4]|tara:strand:- start:4449 stop:5192 length:744 start_codon:yes stop_codon:yes gene_type:complete